MHSIDEGSFSVKIELDNWAIERVKYDLENINIIKKLVSEEDNTFTNVDVKMLLLGFLHFYFYEKFILEKENSALDELVIKTQKSKAFENVWKVLFSEEEVKRFENLIKEILLSILKLSWTETDRRKGYLNNPLSTLDEKYQNSFKEALKVIENMYLSEKEITEKKSILNSVFSNLRAEDFHELQFLSEFHWKIDSKDYYSDDFKISRGLKTCFSNIGIPSTINPQRIAYILYKKK